MTTDPIACPCTDALAQALATGQETTCLSCGSILKHPDRPSASKARQPRVRASKNPFCSNERQVRSYVQDVLRWHNEVERYERKCSKGRSQIAGILEACKLQIVGTGCRGTKSVMVGHSQEMDDAFQVDPIASGRYQSLRGDALKTTDAVRFDGRGDQLEKVRCGEREVDCQLNQRIGLQLGSLKRQTKWHKAIASGDSYDALVEAGALGSLLLSEAALAWFRDNATNETTAAFATR